MFDNIGGEDWSVEEELPIMEKSQGMIICIHCGEYDEPHLVINPYKNWRWSCEENRQFKKQES